MQAAVADILGLALEDVTVEMESATTLAVRVRVLDTTTTTDSSGTVAAVNAITDTVESPSFASTLTSKMVDAGASGISVTGMVGSVETTSVVVLAPSPPPPSSPPSPPVPLAPAVDLLSTTVTSSVSSVDAAATDEAALTLALTMATVAVILLVICLPVGLICIIVYLRRTRGGVQVGQKVFLNVGPERAQIMPSLTDMSAQVDEGAGVLALTMTGGRSPGHRTRPEPPTPSMVSTGVRGRLAAPSDSPMRAVPYTPSSATPTSASGRAPFSASPRSKVTLAL